MIRISLQRSAQHDSARVYKKTGREINSPPGLKLGVVDPKKFGAVNTAWGLVPLFLRCFFLCCFSFLCHRLIPPFQSATRGTL
jgi:hypothetical protein